MKQYFFKLIAPRPTFAQDMNEEEKNYMNQHAEYWNTLLQKGIALAYGPVLHPEGAFSMGIIEVNDESELQEIEGNDPVVKAGILHFEICPMRAYVRSK